ncbi:DotI/IcmL family type IV secretion protein [Legionella sp. CNM-4043-24]|uniref:DotI/IcmL family type IV secretion protein n=1 Tax=Legionella sp. CNM-4043-24 TaxID=3421646 RepID=UPI00403AC872
MSKINRLFCALLILFANLVHAAADDIQKAVWVNEAIVATYTFNASNYLERQREIARYFTAEGWTNYLTALNASGLPATVKQNDYSVSAVALAPPAVTISDNGQSWKATMPLLVMYKNPQQQQKQTLMVTITFVPAATNQGVRGLAMNSLQAKITTEPCQCCAAEESKTDATAAPAGAEQSAPAKAQ